MKTYQDTETGQLHAFDDGIDPFKLNNRNIPATLSEKIIPKPSESHVWYNGSWVKNTETPENYEPPTTNIPSYNPAWIALIKPYTLILPDNEEEYKISLEQINANNYDNEKLSKTVAALPPNSYQDINTLISYDGAIAIPRNNTYSSNIIANEEINRILCAILIGGIHTEIILTQELLCGSLNNEDIFINTPSSHSRLRHKWASMTELMENLMHPRFLRVSELQKAYIHGTSVINSICNFTPFFLLHGYTAMIYQNRSDALSSLWIVVEQLTSFLWENKFFPVYHTNLPKLIEKHKLHDKRFNSKKIGARHELFFETKYISVECYNALKEARCKRNKMSHDGIIPEFETINKLWKYIHELFESASNISPICMRTLVPLEIQKLYNPRKTDFNDWLDLQDKLNT